VKPYPFTDDGATTVGTEERHQGNKLILTCIKSHLCQRREQIKIPSSASVCQAVMVNTTYRDRPVIGFPEHSVVVLHAKPCCHTALQNYNKTFSCLISLLLLLSSRI